MANRGRVETLEPAILHNTLAPRCYHCGAPKPEITDEGQSCIHCGWKRYLSKEALDRIMRKYQTKI